MDAERWRRVKELYHSALERSPQTRASFLADACGGDADLLQTVQSLLAAGERAGGFLEKPAFEMASTLLGAPQLGQQFGSYRILQPLGAGGMGEVYRAQDTRLGRDVAIKTLPHEFARDPERVARLRREARALASLNHPNIAAIYDLEETDGVSCLVLELVEGETLHGPLPLEKALDYARQIAEALEAAHIKGIIHRDLKPANVKVTPEGRVKVLDFGLAKAVWGEKEHRRLSQLTTVTALGTVAGQIMGTPAYMSPEQACGEEVDERTDIWAFGCLLYELLTGKRAFRGAGLADIVTEVLEREPDWNRLPPKTPGAIRDLLRRCLQKDASRRLEDMASARQMIDEVISSYHGVKRWQLIAAAVTVLIVIGIAAVWIRRTAPTSDRSKWAQLTEFPDSVSQPALSPDGRMVTFIRSPDTFASPGQVYVKMLPDGEAVRITNDDLPKMSPVFSPNNSQIAYTMVEAGKWNTWVVPVSGGQPHIWLPNASGLVWVDKRQVLFSEIKNGDIHMAIVKAEESRAGEQDVYVPAGDRDMAHRSYPSPDGRWALVVQMDRAIWVPCRLVPIGGSSSSRPVGPPGAACTFAAWSPDGKWMYLNSGAGGAFHIWRQRFPSGQPEQITSGLTEEEGIAVAPDGRSFVSAVAMKQRSVILHQPNGDRQLSLEGYSYDPKFTSDGKLLCYRVLKGAFPTSDPTELRVLELSSGRDEPLLPGFSVIGDLDRAYDISADGQEVAVAALDPQGKRRLWIAPLDRRSPPRQIPKVEGYQPFFGAGDEIFFFGEESGAAFVYAIHQDGTGLRKLIDQPVAGLVGVSHDGQWVTVRAPGKADVPSVLAFRVRGGPSIRITSTSAGDPLASMAIKWSWDGKLIYVSVPTDLMRTGRAGRTYVIPLRPGQALPPIPVGGFQSEAEIAELPGSRLIELYDTRPGPTLDEYAFSRETVLRNLYRIPLP